LFVDVKVFEVSTAIGAVVAIGVWSVPTLRKRVICCGRVTEVDAGVGEILSVFPRSRSPILGKSLRVGPQNCKRFEVGAMINTANVRNTKIVATR